MPDTGVASPSEPAPVFSGGLYSLRQQVRKESTTCWLLVGLAAITAWSLGPTLAAIAGAMVALFPMVYQQSFGDPGGVLDIEALMMGGSTLFTLFGYLAGGMVSVGVGIGAYFLFRKTRDRTVHDLVYGNMALMLLDEQYGFQIEEAVQARYRVMLGKVPLTGDFPGMVNHFAYYYKYYYRLSYGPSQLQVSTVSAESCWLEGCVLAACNICPVILIPLVLRIVLVRPRVLAIKIAVLEFLEGKHDYLLD